MSDGLRCYRCGESLADLTPPISRQDQCPGCSNYLHVCLMCVNYDAAVPRQCLEDDAEDVTDKEKLNFCDWYKPSADAFDADRKHGEDKARSELARLFGGDEEAAAEGGDDDLNAAEDLFK